MTHPPDLTLHATCVAVGETGVLIIGPAGSGKSSLALALMAYGAVLVADDRTVLTRDGADLVASCPPAIQGMIEARGLGLLHAEARVGVAIGLVVDLGQTEGQRLPPFRNVMLSGRTLPLVLGQTSPHFPAALWHYVKAGRRE
ncbi:serine kinase [Gemmobacter aquarius]|uniref:Serine kinase n=1 Tax=Paragemmobacter aquarius TaxID=2169400 RepID=A0A2S0UHT9_9RHOB|nr:HPr kinase/phosphatase C-terminal domain-containing protein [Gemmobacter aquarius]AWB47397.1 serine kinase [Gemmobacter aquarius]